MPARDSANPAGFGAAFTALLAAAGFTVDGVLGALPEDYRKRVSRSTLYDWKKGQHLPLDATGPLLQVVRVCLAAVGERGATLGVSPGSEGGWRRLLAEAKQARDADIARGRRTSGGEPGSAWSGGPVGERDPVKVGVHQAIGGGPAPGWGVFVGRANELADLAVPLPALGEALNAGILIEEPGGAAARIGFSHLLVQRAVYEDLSPVRRRLHARAAGLVDRDRVLGHRVAAAAGPDEELAARAATAGPDARRSWLLGTLDFLAGRAAAADAQLREAWQAHDPARDPAVGGAAATRLALLCFVGGPGPRGHRMGRAGGRGRRSGRHAPPGSGRAGGRSLRRRVGIRGPGPVGCAPPASRSRPWPGCAPPGSA
jgi:hypothetical protein